MKIQGFSKEDEEKIQEFLINKAVRISDCPERFDTLIVSVCNYNIGKYNISQQFQRFIEKQLSIAIENMRIEEAYELAKTMGFKLEDTCQD
jgi:hypothetical protein